VSFGHRAVDGAGLSEVALRRLRLASGVDRRRQRPRPQSGGRGAPRPVDARARGQLDEVGLALGAQAGEARLRAVVPGAGFTTFLCAMQSPFNLVFEARP